MKRSPKLLCALLAAALLILSVMPACAASVEWGSGKVYLGSSDGSSSSNYTVRVNNIQADTKITSIKSSKKSILVPSALDVGHSTWKELEDPYTSESHDATIYYRAAKKGKAELSFKVDGKQYKRASRCWATPTPSSPSR